MRYNWRNVAVATEANYSGCIKIVEFHCNSCNEAADVEMHSKGFIETVVAPCISCDEAAATEMPFNSNVTTVVMSRNSRTRDNIPAENSTREE